MFIIFCSSWLQDGKFHRSREAEDGWNKSSLQEDLAHVLTTIVEGLDDQIQWLMITIGWSRPILFLEFFVAA
jgi:hypothetical protein